jgi:hypothetical protein
VRRDSLKRSNKLAVIGAATLLVLAAGVVTAAGVESSKPTAVGTESPEAVLLDVTFVQGAPTNLGELKIVGINDPAAPTVVQETEPIMIELHRDGEELRFGKSEAGSPPLRITLSTTGIEGSISLPTDGGEPREVPIGLTARMGADGLVVVCTAISRAVVSRSQTADGKTLTTIKSIVRTVTLEKGEGFAEVFSLGESKVTLIVVPRFVSGEKAVD